VEYPHAKNLKTMEWKSKRKWVFLGVGIGALFHGFFPLQWAETLNSDNLFAVPMAVIVGVPLYFNIFLGEFLTIEFQVSSI
jgi:uncharacterized membrane protein YraQ (UPF0718 family)